jgi:sugar lactone lactonase YvrE
MSAITQNHSITQSHGVERATGTLDILGESAIWCSVDKVLYWVDIRAPALRRLDPQTGQVTSWAVNDLCGAVVLSTDRRLLLAMRTGMFAFDPADETLQPLVAPEPESLNNRLNDSKCDRAGRLWTGTMRDYGLARTGALYRIGHNLSCTRMLGDITVPNALSWSPDNRQMYFADTPDGQIRAYEFDADDGQLGAMKIIESGGTLPGRPDGATVDSEGCLWSARYQGGCVARITPEGRIDRVIELPASQVTSCALGGADLRTLYITTARQKLTPADLDSQPLAGALFAVKVEVGGLPEPRFTLPSER